MATVSVQKGRNHVGVLSYGKEGRTGRVPTTVLVGELDIGGLPVSQSY